MFKCVGLTYESWWAVLYLLPVVKLCVRSLRHPPGLGTARCQPISALAILSCVTGSPSLRANLSDVAAIKFGAA